MRVSIEADENETATLRNCGLMTQNSDLLRTLFGCQREFYKTVGTEAYSDYSPESRYFKSTSSEGWRSYLIHLIGQEDRAKQLQHINDVIARRIALVAKPADPVGVDIDLSNTSVAERLGEITIPETFDMRFGNKIFTVTGVKEDKKQTALLDKALLEVHTEADTQVGNLQQEYATNLERVVRDYDTENETLREQLEHVLPAQHIGWDLLREGVVIDSSDNEHRIFIPMKVTIKEIVSESDGRRWELLPEYVEKFDTYLMVAVDNEFHVRWTHLYDRKFKDTIPLWHYSSGQICLGSVEPKMMQLWDIMAVRDDMQKMLEKINLDSIGKHNISNSPIQCDIKHAIHKYNDEMMLYRDDDIDEKPTISVAKEVGETAWTV